MHCSANQGGTAEFIWSFGPLSEMAEDRMIFLYGKKLRPII